MSKHVIKSDEIAVGTAPANGPTTMEKPTPYITSDDAAISWDTGSATPPAIVRSAEGWEEHTRTVGFTTVLEVEAGVPTIVRVYPPSEGPSGPTTVTVASAAHGTIATLDFPGDGGPRGFQFMWPNAEPADALTISDDRGLWAPLPVAVRVVALPPVPDHVRIPPVNAVNAAPAMVAAAMRIVRRVGDTFHVRTRFARATVA